MTGNKREELRDRVWKEGGKWAGKLQNLRIFMALYMLMRLMERRKALEEEERREENNNRRVADRRGKNIPF